MSFDRDPAGSPSYPPPAGRPRRGDGWSPGRFSPAILLVAVIVVAILIGAAVFSRRNAGPAATATAGIAGQSAGGSASAAPTPAAAAPSAAASPAPAVSPTTAPAAATPTARVFVVANTDGDGVYLRRTPSLADRDTAYIDGTRLVAIGPDVTGEGELWHHVRAPDGRIGYVPAKYTVEAPR